MFTRRSLTTTAIVLSFLSFGALLPVEVGAAAAVKPAEPAAKEQTFFESVDVSVVNVDVVVTDRGGKPVTGLTAADFTVTEDGKPVELSNFYAEAGGPGAGAPGAAGSAATAAPVPADQRLNLAIFIDNRNILPPARNRILKSIEKFLAAHPLNPTDHVLLATYDGTVEVHQTPTNDGAVLHEALENAAKGSTRGIERSIDQRQVLSELQQAALPPLPGGPPHPDSSQMQAEELYNNIQVYAEKRLLETRSTLVSVGQFVDSLSGLPGRKALLYVTGGLSLRPGQALFDAYQAKYSGQAGSGPILRASSSSEAWKYDATDDFNRLIDRANANRVTFYTLGSPEDVSGKGAAEAGDNTAWRDQSGTESMNIAAPLHQLAASTGGVAALDAIDPGAMLDRMRLDFDSYYSLGYLSRHRDGKTHKIAVKVRDKSLKVRTREAFRDRTGDERTTDRLTAALLLGVAENPLGIAMDFGPETHDKKGETKVEVTVKFPIANLVLTPQEHFHEGHVMLFLAARDSHGRNSQVTRVAVPIRIPNEQLVTALGQTAGYKTTLPLRDEQHTLAVAVRDELGNADSTLRVSYTPGQGNTVTTAAKVDH